MLSIADSGAGVHAINDARLAIPGSLRPNSTAISTASGRCIPEHVCNAYLDTVASDGSVVRLMLDDAILIPECKHNLISLGLLAEKQGITSHIKAGGHSFMELPDGRRVNLINKGIFVIPDVASVLMHAATIDEPDTAGSLRMWNTIHNRFNGRSYDVLRNLVSCGQAVPREWSRALKHPPKQPCLSCLRARADKVHSKSHVPHASEPGYISYDIFEMGIAYMFGGQKYVIGFHDA